MQLGDVSSAGSATMQEDAPAGLAPTADLLNSDVLGHILSHLPTTDLLSCACVASTLQRTANGTLLELRALRLSGSATSDHELGHLVLKRLRGSTLELDVSACTKISKACVVKSVKGSPNMATLNAREVGAGSWTPMHLAKLQRAAPASLRSIEIDCRIAINVDVPIITSLLLTLPSLRIRRLTIIKMTQYAATAAAAAAAASAALMLAAGAAAQAEAQAAAAQPAPEAQSAAQAPEAQGPEAQAPQAHAEDAQAEDAQAEELIPVEPGGAVADAVDGPAAMPQPAAAHPAAGAAAGVAAAGVAAAGVAAAGVAAAGVAAGVVAPAPNPLDGLRRLLAEKGELHALDGSSGALGRDGYDVLVSPLLRAERCSLRWLGCSAVPRESAEALIAALAVNNSLTTLQLGCNSLTKQAAAALGGALRSGCTQLRRLTVEHNQTLDSGGSAILGSCMESGLETLSLAFTGAGDASCAAAADVIRAHRPLARLSLCGNAVSPSGVAALVDAMGKAGASAPFRALNLSCNHLIDASAASSLARILPTASLTSLELAGCAIDSKTVGLFAAALPQSRIAHLDLSANHFGDVGAWSLAWALPDSTSLRLLDIFECDITDDGATELYEGLLAKRDAAGGGPRGDKQAPLVLDVRGNRISTNHPLALDEHVRGGFQRRVQRDESWDE